MRTTQVAPFAINRRALLASAVMLAAGRAVSVAASADDPVALVTALYRAAVKNSQTSLVSDAGQRRKYLSKDLIALWAKADAKTPAGDEGPIDFDLVADTNGLTLKGFSLALEKSDAKSATVAATLAYKEGNSGSKPSVVRYDLTCEDGRWRIDEIRGAEWSARQMLANALKEP